MSDNGGYLPLPKGFNTAAIHAGYEPEESNSLCVVPPVVISTIFKQKEAVGVNKYLYGRDSNPTRESLEIYLAAVEAAKYALVFSSGLGALTTLMSIFPSGTHVICSDVLFGGTCRWFDRQGVKYGIDKTYVDAVDPENVKKAIKPNTKLIYIETPANPNMKIIDMKAVAQVARNNKLLLVVDNTFLTPYFQRPLEFGADISLYSLTKYINGHTDVIMGALVTNNETLYSQFKSAQSGLGIIPAPMDCALVIRSLKTLSLRMREHRSNALAVAKFLETHPKVIKVLHPGLPSHPQHELSKKQSSGHSGMFAFYLRGGLQESQKFLNNLKIITYAGSLGSPESLACIPCTMTHKSLPDAEKKALQITDNLIRVTIGLEDAEDLIDDIKQALDSI